MRRSAHVFPQQTAVVHEGRYTYGEFFGRVRRLAGALAQAGVGPGDRVAFLYLNKPPLLEAHDGVPAGTAGQPRGAVYTHRGAYLNARGGALEVGLSSRSVYLWTLPTFHCNGWCYTWAPPAPQTIRNMEAISFEVVHLYGLAETYGPSTI